MYSIQYSAYFEIITCAKLHIQSFVFCQKWAVMQAVSYNLIWMWGLNYNTDICEFSEFK